MSHEKYSLHLSHLQYDLEQRAAEEYAVDDDDGVDEHSATGSKTPSIIMSLSGDVDNTSLKGRSPMHSIDNCSPKDDKSGVVDFKFILFENC